MRTRRHFRSPRKRNPLQWWATQTSGVANNDGGFLPLGFASWGTISPGITASAYLIGTQTEVGIIGGPSDRPSNPQQMTVHAIRGDILFSGPPSPSPDPIRIFIAMGILPEEMDSTGAVPFRDPSDPGNGSLSWLWLHSDVMMTTGAAFSSQFVTNGVLRVPVLVKSKRRLKQNEKLMLHVVCNYQNAAANAVVTRFRPALRVLYGKSAP